MTPAWLLLFASFGAARAGTVEMNGARLHELLDVPVPPEPELPPPLAASREVTLVPVEHGLQVHATWTVRAAKPGWFTGTLIGAGAHVGTVTWNGETAALSTTSAGAILAGWVDDSATVVLDAFVPGDQVTLLPAVEGRVHLQGDQALTADGAPALTDGTDWITGGSVLARVPPPPTPAAGTVVLARDGIGLTIGDAAVDGRAHLVWVVRRGKLDAVAVRASGVGADLAVDGPNVASWTRSGDRVDITLREPADDRVDLTLSWSVATPAGTEAKLPLPQVEPLDAFRTEATVQIAREEGLEVVPQMAGWTPIASSEVPEWGRGLVQGAPAASYHAGSVPGGRLDLLRFQPVDLPPAVVDVADYRVTTTAEGRLLTRAFLEVRNERAPWLRVTPPEGWRIVGVRVAGDTARPVTDGKPGWLVPLPRSVQTVEGLISFTVEVTFLGQDTPWRNGDRALSLPVVDADCADWRVTVFLPPGWKGLNRVGQRSVVGDFAEGEGLSYGLGRGAVGAAGTDEEFQDAVSAWLNNDFTGAQQALDDLRAQGIEGQNIDYLQSNLDLVGGKRDDADYAARQVRAQARARAAGQVIEQQELAKKAEKSKQAGDLKGASEYYSKALDIGGTLAQLESGEQVEAKEANTQYKAELEKIQQDIDERKAALGDEDQGEAELPWNVEGKVDWNTSGTPDWNTSGTPAWEPPPEAPEPSEASGSGEGGGVSGGALGGVAYGAAGIGATGDGTIATSSLKNVPAPASRDYTTSAAGVAEESIMARRRGLRGFHIRGHGRRSHASAFGAGEAVFEGMDIQGELLTPDVHASSLSVTVPAIGVRVRFQRHLVPAAAAEQVALRAHATPGERSKP